jgi:hypothetical protein
MLAIGRRALSTPNVAAALGIRGRRGLRHQVILAFDDHPNPKKYMFTHSPLQAAKVALLGPCSKDPNGKLLPTQAAQD